jgi:hypothetical protein
MNEKILVLAQQAMEAAYQSCEAHNHKIKDIDVVWTSFCLIIFSELVINECAEIANSLSEDNIGSKIKHQFGLDLTPIEIRKD